MLTEETERQQNDNNDNKCSVYSVHYVYAHKSQVWWLYRLLLLFDVFKVVLCCVRWFLFLANSLLSFAATTQCQSCTLQFPWVSAADKFNSTFNPNRRALASFNATMYLSHVQRCVLLVCDVKIFFNLLTMHNTPERIPCSECSWCLKTEISLNFNGEWRRKGQSLNFVLHSS